MSANTGGDLRVSGSIRRRLALILLAGAALLSGVFFVLVHGFARQVAQRSQDNILTASVTSILDSASVQGGEIGIDIPYAALSMLGNVSDDRVFYRITAGGEVLTGYGDLPPVSPAPRGGETVFATVPYKGEPVRMASAARSLSRGAAPVQVVATVAQTLTGRARTLARIGRISAALGGGFFLASVVLALVAAQASVRPLDRLAGAVSRRGPKDLRPVSAPVPAEMAPLVRSLNSFIARLRTSLARSEDFIAEAAHRVRTPLATVRTQAEVALRRVERPENREALKEMIRAVDESSRAAGQLLDHAMVTFRTDHLDRSPVDLAALAGETVDRLRPVAELKDIALELDLQARPGVSGDAILLQSALQNILDNAVKYSPPDAVIRLELGLAGGRAALRVLDQGSGFPPGDAARLTRRFERGDNAAATVGSGLGLTIAREVAEAHGGELHLANRKERTGACVTLFLPL